MPRRCRCPPLSLVPRSPTWVSNPCGKDSIKVRTNLIKYDPQNAKNYLQLARLYRDTGNIDKAIEILDWTDKMGNKYGFETF
jgi:tetratricopeptide (TPR) repeat protein